MRHALKILIIEDSPDDLALVTRALQKGTVDPILSVVDSRLAMETALQNETWDVIISDFDLGDFNGLDTLDHYQKNRINAPLLIVSGAPDQKKCEASLQKGACGFIDKSDLNCLVPAIERALWIRTDHSVSLAS